MNSGGSLQATSSIAIAMHGGGGGVARRGSEGRGGGGGGCLSYGCAAG
jgi:hypothetical protein